MSSFNDDDDDPDFVPSPERSRSRHQTHSPSKKKQKTDDSRSSRDRSRSRSVASSESHHQQIAIHIILATYTTQCQGPDFWNSGISKNMITALIIMALPYHMRVPNKIPHLSKHIKSFCEKLWSKDNVPPRPLNRGGGKKPKHRKGGQPPKPWSPFDIQLNGDSVYGLVMRYVSSSPFVLHVSPSHLPCLLTDSLTSMFAS